MKCLFSLFLGISISLLLPSVAQSIESNPTRYIFDFISTPSGDLFLYPMDIANDGTVVGRYCGPTVGCGGFIYKNGSLQKVRRGDFEGRNTTITGINNNGEFCGIISLMDGQTGFMCSSTGCQDLELDLKIIRLDDMNIHGKKVGQSFDGAFVGDVGDLHIISLPWEDTRHPYPRSINDNGEHVGWFGEGTGFDRSSYLYSNNTYKKIKVAERIETIACGVNNLTEVVGFYGSSPFRGFLYKNDVYYDFNLPESLGNIESVNLYGINDSGQIVGICRIDSQHHAFIATPRKATAIPSIFPLLFQ